MAAAIAAHETAASTNKNALDSNAIANQGTQLCMQNLVDLFTKLNPSAKEFFPSRHSDKSSPDLGDYANSPSFSRNGVSFLPDSQFPMRSLGAIYSLVIAGEEANSIRDEEGSVEEHTELSGRITSNEQFMFLTSTCSLVTEEMLAKRVPICIKCWILVVLDCRICGDPHSVLHFAFVEFADEYGATAALSLGGMMLGYYLVRVLPCRTAILPVNPSYLPRSEGEREMCARTVCCTNIDKMVSQTDIKRFFETACGKVALLRLLGDQLHSTHIAFVEFSVAESTIAALSCSGMVLGTQLIRVSPSKTRVRPRVSHPSEN